MKIKDIQCILVSAPYASPEDAERKIHLQTGYRPASFFKITTDEEVYGVGETYAGTYAPEVVQALSEQIKDDLIGQNPMHILDNLDRMRVANNYLGRMGLTQSVIGGIEMALWDLKGKWFNVPVYELLGGKMHEQIPVYASGGNNKPFSELEAEMKDYVDRGYKTVKIRINQLPDADAIEEKVAFCRKVLGKTIGLAVDCCQGLERNPWTVKKAVEVASRLQPYQLEWLEEPAAVTNYAGYAEIKANTSIRVAGGETVTSLVEAENYLQASGLDLFQPDASVIGGLHIFRRVAEMCERKFIPIAVHAWCGGVGMMGNYHAAFASKNCEILEMSSVYNPLREVVLSEPIQFKNGQMKAPSVPGLGIDLPADLEEKYPYRPGSVYRVPLD